MNSHLGFCLLAAIVLLFGAIAPLGAGEITIVDEDFNDYDHFPDEKPDNDPVNFGVPLVGEGADSDLWLAVRFEAFDNDPIYEDVGVQQYGGGGNSSPVGRAGDDAGLVLRLDLRELTDVTLDFDWRTFLAESSDRFVVAYYQGDGTEFKPGGLGMPGEYYDWFNDPDLGGGVMDLGDGSANSWYQNHWVELLRASEHNQFQHQSYDLPGGDILYLAFWLDNGNKDFGKFDNILVMGNPVEHPIPEPSTWILAMLGSVGICGVVRKRRRRS